MWQLYVWYRCYCFNLLFVAVAVSYLTVSCKLSANTCTKYHIELPLQEWK